MFEVQQIINSVECRSRTPELLRKKGVLKDFAKFTGKHLCQSLFLNKVVTLLKKRVWHRCFPVSFAKFLRTPFLYNTTGGCFCAWRITKEKFKVLPISNHEEDDTRLSFHGRIWNKVAVIVVKDLDVFVLLIYALGQWNWF